MKLAGLFLLMLAGVGGGAIVAADAARGVEQTKELVRLLRILLERIETYREPLPDFFADFSSPVLTACGFLPAYPSAPEKAFSCLFVPAELSEQLAELAGSLGNQSAQATGEAIRRVLESAEREAARMEEALPGKRKAALTLGCCGWLLFLLLLW